MVRYRVSEHEFGVLISCGPDERLYSRATARTHAHHLAHGAQKAGEQGRLLSPQGHGMPGAEGLTPEQGFALASCLFRLSCDLEVRDGGERYTVAVRIAEDAGVAADVVV